MTKFPSDAPKKRVLRALELLGFRVVREQQHIAMVRENADGTRNLKAPTPRTADGHPDLTGIWEIYFNSIAAASASPGAP